MRRYLLFAACVLSSSCNLQNNKRLTPSKFALKDSASFKVFKIDSINTYYLIYAKKGRDIFKIISRKGNEKCPKSISVNQLYSFSLRSILTKNGQQVIPPNQINEISWWQIDKNTVIRFEGDSINNLYFADNLQGLCLIKSAGTR